MNPLLSAILDRDIARVRAVAQQRPELLSERLVSGELPIEFAASNPLYIQILVCFVRSGAPGSERFADWQELLESYVRYLSDSFACAGWLSNIEFTLWCIMASDPLPSEEPYGFAALSGGGEIQDLQFLCDKGQHWPYWDRAELRVKMAPLVRWQHMYQDWYAQQTAKQNSP